jgi:hypothetical protein
MLMRRTLRDEHATSIVLEDSGDDGKRFGVGHGWTER